MIIRNYFQFLIIPREILIYDLDFGDEPTCFYKDLV